MEINIDQYEYVKKKIKSRVFTLPETIQYLFETGIRRSIRIEPIFTTWNKENYDKDEELYEYKVTCVYGSFECKIEVFNIRVSSIADPLTSQDKSFIEAWTKNHFNKREKAQFDADLAASLAVISSPDGI